MFEFWNKFRLLTQLSLLILIVLRLVWLQVHPSTPRIEPRFYNTIENTYNNRNHQKSLDFCNLGGFLVLQTDLKRYQIWIPNQQISSILNKRLLTPCLNLKLKPKDIIDNYHLMLCLLVFILLLLTRVLTRSWTTALIVAATLLSSSSITRGQSLIGYTLIGQLLLATWTLLLAYFCRNFSWRSLIPLFAYNIWLISLGLFGFAWIMILAPLFIWMIKKSSFLKRAILRRIRQHNQQHSILPSKPKVSLSLSQKSHFFSSIGKLRLFFQDAYHPRASKVYINKLQSKTALSTINYPITLKIMNTSKRKIFTIILASKLILLTFAAIIFYLNLRMYGADLFQSSALLGWKAQIIMHISEAYLGLPNPRLLLILIIFIASLLTPPHLSILNFFEFSWFFSVCLIGLIIGGSLNIILSKLLLGYYITDLVLLNYFDWFIPTFYAFAIMATYNILRSVLSRKYT